MKLKPKHASERLAPKLPSLLAVSAGLLLGLSAAQAQVTLVSELFDGTASTNLNGTSPSVNSAITDAGGSSTWVAATWDVDIGGGTIETRFDFSTDGSVNGSYSTNTNSAALNLGSYINDARGTADAYFELSATISETVGNNWLSLGFSTLNNPNVTETSGSPSNWTSGGTEGIATIIYRDKDGESSGAAGELDMYVGPRTGGGVDGPDGNTGPRTLTVALDFRPDVYDGTTTYGIVTWSDSELGVLGTGSFSETDSFGSILLSTASTSGTYSNLTLTQVPEPSAALLIGLSVVGLAMVRRRRS